MKILAFFQERLSEASTWRGIISIITACGVAIAPDQVEAIVAAGLAIVGAIGVFTKDATK